MAKNIHDENLDKVTGGTAYGQYYWVTEISKIMKTSDSNEVKKQKLQALRTQALSVLSPGSFQDDILWLIDLYINNYV